MSGCSPGVNCDSCNNCGEKVSFSIRRAPGTCCPEPSCDYPREPGDLVCKMCGADCRTCPVRKTPTCCPEPSCDQELAPVKCKTCGATCPCPAWERQRKDRDYFANAERGRPT